MEVNGAASEIIGVILLIGIIIAAFSIFAAIYLPTIKPNPIPQVQLSMACSDTGNDDDKEYPCTRGSFSCYPSDAPFDNETCENDCKLRDYSQDPPYSSDNLEREILRCMENCVNPMCSDLNNCEYLHICHNGGDSLAIYNMKIIVNGGNPIPIDNWEMRHPSISENYTSPPKNGLFGIGDSLKLHGLPSPVDTVMITYNLSSGGEVILVLNQFGTDVNI